MPDVPLSRRAVLAGIATAVAAPALSQDRATITLGQVSLSFYAVTGAVVEQVLLRLGHRVVVREGLHEAMFPLLGDASIDLMAAAWLPEGHADYWRRYGNDAQEVATLYDGARFFWAVPDYVPSSVRSIDDLARPELANRFVKRIQGIGSGAAISQLSRKVLPAYGLDKIGYHFAAGTQQQWIGAYGEAKAAGRWIVFPTWAPQFLNRGAIMRPLTDSKGLLGKSNRAVLAAPTQRWQALPERTRTTLSRIALGLDAVTEMDWLVNSRSVSPRDAARTWMAANGARVDQWFVS